MNDIQKINHCITELLSDGCEVILGINENNQLSVIFYGRCSIWAFIKKPDNDSTTYEYGVIEKKDKVHFLKVVDNGENLLIDAIDFINIIGKDFSQSNIKPKQNFFKNMVLLEVMYSDKVQCSKKSHWKYINNDCFYRQGGRFIDSRLEKNIKGYYCIDGLHSHDIRTSTELARVILTDSDEIIVIYINELAKYDDYAQEKIQESTSWLKDKRHEGYGM